MGPTLSFITVTSYTALHKVARALEDPFVHPPNDLPANAIQAAFNNRLLATWDAVRRKEDNLPEPGSAAAAQSSQTGSPSRHAGSNGSGNGSNGAAGPEEDDASPRAAPACYHIEDYDFAALWGEYTDLEDDEVRGLIKDLLHEWRAGGSRRAQQRRGQYNQVATPKLVKAASPSQRVLKRHTTAPLYKRHRMDSPGAGLMAGADSSTRSTPVPRFSEGTPADSGL